LKAKARRPAAGDAIELRAVAALAPYARNARTHAPEQVEQIAASLRAFRWTNPILIDEKDGIVAGHGRVLAAEKLYAAGETIQTVGGSTLPAGMVPVIVARGWTDEQKRAYVVADNKLAENAGWDRELLKLELGELKALDFDLAPIGFSGDELGALFAAPADGIETPGAGSYKEQYGVIVICADEAEQQAVYERLKGEGLTVRVVTT
jgi:ParB-like chromosome segregation protein Spo0J